MNDIAGQLHDALEQQGIPIEGVSIGRRHDRSTWRVDFAPTATDAQRSAAAALLRTLIWSRKSKRMSKSETGL